MSLKSAIVMYRVDGVSGLNVLTGIMTKVLSATFEVGRPSFLSLLGISYRSANMLSKRPFGRRGTCKLSNAKLNASAFLKNFRLSFRHKISTKQRKFLPFAVSMPELQLLADFGQTFFPVTFVR